VIDRESPLPHHLFQVAIAERVPQVPAHKPRQSFGNSSVQECWQKDRSGLDVLSA
jgi:hypothetical protein